MKGQMQLYYDEEGDFLEINIGEYTEGYFRDVGEDIAERIDEKTGKVRAYQSWDSRNAQKI